MTARNFDHLPGQFTDNPRIRDAVDEQVKPEQKDKDVQ
jgi:hypothetical protein